MDEDVQFIKAGDVFYIALDGEEFNNCAILDEYEIGKVLGQGGFGQVLHAKHRETKKKFAIKFMDISEQRECPKLFQISPNLLYLVTNANAVQSIFKEAQNMKKMRHKNIIELYHSFIEKKQLIMIMEYASGGELLGYLEKKGTLSETDTRDIM